MATKETAVVERETAGPAQQLLGLTLEDQVEQVTEAIRRLPTSGPSGDLARSLTKLTNLEKATRKVRIDWLACLVKNASQGVLGA